VSITAKTRWALRHPASAARPATVLTRLAVWRTRTAVGAGATVPVTPAAMRFWCPPEWRGNAKMMYVWRDAYESELSQLHRWVRPGDVVVDVGAHYGAYTLPLARLVGETGQVVAVEPARHACSVLTRNVRINGLGNVRVLPVAAGDQTASGTLHLHGDRSRASLHQTLEVKTGTEQVKVVRLDEVVQPDRRVSLIKVDVEGYEVKVLQGAEGILSRDRPVVIFEYLPGMATVAGLPASGAWDLLRSHGYGMHRVVDTGEVLPVEGPAENCGTTSNVVAIHPGSRTDADEVITGTSDIAR
jgi:FkbM family methyltransferase